MQRLKAPIKIGLLDIKQAILKNDLIVLNF